MQTVYTPYRSVAYYIVHLLIQLLKVKIIFYKLHDQTNLYWIFILFYPFHGLPNFYGGKIFNYCSENGVIEPYHMFDARQNGGGSQIGNR